MSVKYDFYENPQPAGKQADTTYHARVVGSHTVSTQELLRHMHIHGVKESTMLYAMSELGSVLQEELLKGNNVHLDGIGYFSITLDCPETHDPKEHHAQSISLKSVTFRPEKALVKNLASKIDFERTPYKTKSQAWTTEEIEKALDVYFADHDFLTNKALQEFCSITRSTAASRLKELVAKGVLVNKGTRHFPVFVPAK